MSLEKAEAELVHLQKQLEELVPLGIKWRNIKCGKKCRCTRGMPHGPYPYLRIKKEGRWVHQYLGKGWEPPEGMCKPSEYRVLLRRYKAHLRLVEQMRDLLSEE